ncbi:MAG: glucose-1-phosphate adenylyltransferase, partial [Planctomycetota bacterium]
IIDGATIKYSVIGLRSRISANVIIENSILSGNDYYDSGISINNVPALGVAPGSIIRGSILDKNVRVGRNVHIENLDGVAHYDHPDGLFYIRDYIVVIPKGIVLPDGFRTQVRP